MADAGAGVALGGGPPPPPPLPSSARVGGRGGWREHVPATTPAVPDVQAQWAAAYPVHAAACENSGTVLERLLLHGGSGLNDLDREGRAPLHYCAWNGLERPLQLLLAAGANVNIRTPDRGSTPLHFAAGMGHPACVDVLISGGADADLLDLDRWTPAALAAQNLNGLPDAVVAQLVAACRRAEAELASRPAGEG
jgi:hypothetical protein